MEKQKTTWRKRLLLIIVISAGLQLLTLGVQIVFANSFIKSANEKLEQTHDINQTEGYLRTFGYFNIESFLKEDLKKIENEAEHNNEEYEIARNNFFTQKLQMNTLSAIVWTVLGFIFYYGCVLFSRKNKVSLIIAIIVAVLGIISYALSTVVYVTGFIYAFPTSYVLALIGLISCVAIIVSSANVLKEKSV